MKTRQELKQTGELYRPPYSLLGQAYRAMASGKTNINTLLHSDIYYVRAALEKRLGVVLPLGRVEALMRLAGWREGKRKGRKNDS